MADTYQRSGGPVGEHYMRGLYRGQDEQPAPPQQHPAAVMVAKAVVAAVATGAMLLLSGLTLTGTVIALIVATPLLVIFSPVLVTAAIAMALLSLGFLSSGGFGIAALSVLVWMYRYVAGKSPEGAEQMDYAGGKVASKVQEAKEWAQHRLDQARTP